MNNEQYIVSVEELIASTESLVRDSNDHLLFRGQPNNDPLLPKVARRDPKRDTTEIEKKMVKEFRRRLAHERDIAAMDEWDVLVYAQHYGLATRLLDWTTNPLFALWFACTDYRSSSDGYIFLLTVKEEELLDTSVENDPFNIKKSYVVKPNLNNNRIRSQSGWFTVHRYSQEAKQFVDLHKNTSIKGKVLKKAVRQNKKLDLLKMLDKLGVNEETVYLGAEGAARHINWLHRDDLYAAKL